MLKIVLYGRVNSRKKVQEVLKEYFNKASIQLQIYNTSNSLKFMTDYLNNDEFHIFIACMDRNTIYMIKSNIYDMNNTLIVGHMSFPPRQDEIYKSLLRNYELSNVSIHGKYTVKSCEILRGDIEYIMGEGKESIFYLKDGSSISSDQELKKVEIELGKEYFIRCSNKCIVNILNIYKLYNSEGHLNKIELVSGSKIPVSRAYANRLMESYLQLTPESASLKKFDI